MYFINFIFACSDFVVTVHLNISHKMLCNLTPNHTIILKHFYMQFALGVSNITL